MLHRAVAVQHGVRAQVNVRGEQLLDQRTQHVGPGEARDLVAELEVLEDLLDVGREAVEVGLEVGLELLLAGAGLEVTQRELRGVVERLPGGLAQRRVLMDDLRRVERGLHVEHGLLGRLEHRVEPAQDGHRQDDVAVLAADVEIPQHVVGDAPDEVRDPVELALFHETPGSVGRPNALPAHRRRRPPGAVAWILIRGPLRAHPHGPLRGNSRIPLERRPRCDSTPPSRPSTVAWTYMPGPCRLFDSADAWAASLLTNWNWSSPAGLNEILGALQTSHLRAAQRTVRCNSVMPPTLGPATTIGR